MQMDVSIIIPTANRCESLARTLGSIARTAALPNHFEVIVIDNASTDNTLSVFETARAQFPRIEWRYAYEPVPGLLSGRHRGAQEARGDVFTFIDDDVDVTDTWLDAIRQTFSDPAVQLVGGRNLPRFDVTPPEWIDDFWFTPIYGGRACVHLSLLDLGDRPQEVDANYVWGLNFSIRREAFHKSGGFHPDCIPPQLQRFQGDGETGLTLKANALGWRAMYQPQATLYHVIPKSRLTVEYFRRRAYYQGVCDSFSKIRKLKSVDPKNESSSETPRWKRIYRSTRAVLGEALRAIRSLKSSPVPSDSSPRCREMEATLVLIDDAYQAGFDYHQAEVGSDPTLLDWVLRDTYWDYQLPAGWERYLCEISAQLC